MYRVHPDALDEYLDMLCIDELNLPHIKNKIEESLPDYLIA